jgi:uncharacterized protein DUF397
MNAKTYSDSFDRNRASWVKSATSNEGGNYVELSPLGDGGMAVRDSKDPEGPILFFTPSEWAAFVGGVKDGEFDL